MKSVTQGVEWQITDEMLVEGVPLEKTKAMISHILERTLREDRPSSKEQAVVDYIASTPMDDKVIIYSFYTGILQGIERALSISGFRSILITGKSKHHTERLDEFDRDPGIKVLLVTLKLGNAGLNIISANHVLIVDPWWNPYVMEQAEYRVQRPGQLKQVYVVYFIMDHTLELAIMNLTIRKKGILDSFLEPSSKNETISEEEESLLFNYNISVRPN